MFAFLRLDIKFYFKTLLFIVALLIVITTVFMIVFSYTPIPYWDAWDSQKAFVRKLLSSSDLFEMASLMFEQHNEHRIALTRVFILVDDLFFKGKSVFLFALNLIIPLLFLILIFWLIKPDYITAIFAMTLVFSFEQWENFTWALQSQFFIAAYVPFIGYLLISKQNIKQLNKYALIFLFSLISLFTLASGAFFTIPLLIYFVVKDRNIKDAAVTLISFAFVIFLNFFILGYMEPEHHGGLKDVYNYGLKDVSLIFIYVINYFSSLFNDLLGAVAGLFFITLYIICLFYGRENPDCSTSRAMSLFILFYILWASATAVGRAEFGVGQAFSSRYTTPTAVAWLSLAILAYNHFVKHQEPGSRYLKNTYYSTVVFFVLLLGFNQYKTTNNWSWDDKKHRSELAMLAMTLDVGGSDLTGIIYPNDDRVRKEFSLQQARGDKSLLEGEWFKLAGQLESQAKLPVSQCLGQIEALDPIRGGYKVSGWLISPTQKQVSVLNDQKEVVGVGLIGGRREDVVEFYPRTGRYSGFTALIKGELASEPVGVSSIKILVESGEGCVLNSSIS